MRHSDVKEVLREIKSKLCARCGSGQNQNQDQNREVTPARRVQHLRAITDLEVQQRVDQEHA